MAGRGEAVIDWRSVDPQRFERAVQALLKRKYPGLRSVDGAGGDGGRDAQLVTPDGLTVFEMKSFTGSLTKKQRAQIVSSLKRAVSHASGMTRWVLVIPKNQTPRLHPGRYSDESWFQDELVRVAPGVELEWCGKDWLDIEASHDLAFQNYVEGAHAQVLQRAAEFKQESEVLAGGAADLFRRNETLRRRADEISLYWRLNWHVRNGIQTFELEEKYPGAAQDDPIVLRPSFAFDLAEDPDAMTVKRELVKTLSFGGRVEVPGKYLQSFDVDASPEACLLLRPGDGTTCLRIESVAERLEPPVAGWMSYIDDNDESAVELEIFFRERVGGREGVTLRGGDAAGLLSIELALPQPPEYHVAGTVLAGTGISFETRDVSGASLDAVSKLVNLLGTADGGRRLRVQLAMGITLIGQPLDEALFPDAEPLIDVVSALVRLQRHAGKRLWFPREMTEEQADMLLVAAQLLEGEQVPIEASEWTASVIPGQAKAFVRQFSKEPFALLFSRVDAVLVAGDLQIPYGPLCQWGPDLSLANRQELESYEGVDPVQARFRTGEHPVCWLPYAKAEELTSARLPTAG